MGGVRDKLLRRLHALGYDEIESIKIIGRRSGVKSWEWEGVCRAGERDYRIGGCETVTKTVRAASLIVDRQVQDDGEGLPRLLTVRPVGGELAVGVHPMPMIRSIDDAYEYVQEMEGVEGVGWWPGTGEGDGRRFIP